MPNYGDIYKVSRQGNGGSGSNSGKEEEKCMTFLGWKGRGENDEQHFCAYFLNGNCSVRAGRGCTTMVGRKWEDKSLTCVNCTLAKRNNEDWLWCGI